MSNVYPDIEMETGHFSIVMGFVMSSAIICYPPSDLYKVHLLCLSFSCRCKLCTSFSTSCSRWLSDEDALKTCGAGWKFKRIPSNVWEYGGEKSYSIYFGTIYT